ncbi:PP2C family protein-serine/threonine phosphatase [Streptomyces prasinopilosus]|uniref:Stage II sporulation protein E (SpoIIE) n=1 Tax=Streptomyces prasinopilosus TaxID=67344 RepID=A0A1G6TA88_9ACTN|nr:PP2C family protein-serine/threonine phosphatase [Streptomyces prasinopilosus]SDD25971.1 Stage II sporulation protein E (SpoIIE) [Streptomyces prasinopilosus]
MSHARQHRDGHRPVRRFRGRGAGRPPLPRIRALVHRTAGTPVLPLLLVCVITVIDVVGGTSLVWLPMLAAGPALAAATCGWRGVAGVGLLATLLSVVLGVRNGVSGGHLVAVLAVLASVTLASILAGAVRARREQVLAAVRSVAETAQHALLQPPPATVGPFQVAVHYSAAAAEARIGGDLYALIPTPHGVRMIVGDVRGKGLSAVKTAALVLGVFREAAYDEPDLLAVVGRIERSLARNLGDDDFVTAVVAGYPEPGRLELVNCGHAPPLLVRGSDVVAVEPARPAPPLGLSALAGEAPGLQVLPFGDGDQLLLYTDGVTEARDADRAFYPLAEGFARHLYDDPARTVAALHEELLTHVGGRLHDDAALLLLRKPAAARPAATGPETGEGATGEGGSAAPGSSVRATEAAGPGVPAPAAAPPAGPGGGAGERRRAA